MMLLSGNVAAILFNFKGHQQAMLIPCRELLLTRVQQSRLCISTEYVFVLVASGGLRQKAIRNKQINIKV